MTHDTSQAPLDHGASDLPPPAPPGAAADPSVRRASLTAGVGLMLMSVLAAFGNLMVVQGLVTPGDAAQTAKDIAASDGMFRFGVTSMYLVVVLDVVIAWALFRVFAPVNESISRLAAWFRLVYAGVFMVAISQLAGIPDLLASEGYSTAFPPQQLQAEALLKVDAFNDIWYAGLILFGAHLLIIGFLAYKSGYVPRVLGVLIVIAGVGYAFDSFVFVFSEGSPMSISMFTFLGEFLLGLWLLIRGRHITLKADGHAI